MSTATMQAPGAAGLPDLVKDDELCRLLDRTQQTIRNLVRNGELPAPIVIGRRRYWDRETIARFLRGESGDADAGALLSRVDGNGETPGPTNPRVSGECSTTASTVGRADEQRPGVETAFSGNPTVE